MMVKDLYSINVLNFKLFFSFAVDSYNTQGELVLKNQVVSFAVGCGGFGGPRASKHAVPCAKRPNRTPDKTVQEKTSTDQAALYRLSGTQLTLATNN